MLTENESSSKVTWNGREDEKCNKQFEIIKN